VELGNIPQGQRLIIIKKLESKQVLIYPKISFFSFFFFFLFRAVPAAYGGSRARGLIGAVAAGLFHSHSNARSEPSLQTAPELKARDQTCNLMVSSWIRFHCAMMGTPKISFIQCVCWGKEWGLMVNLLLWALEILRK